MNQDADPPPDRSESGGPPLAPLRSVHSDNLPAILDRIAASLVVSTYQAGRIILVRLDGGVLNTHFRPCDRPMGIAGDGQRLAIGSRSSIWTLRNVPALARKLDPPGKHDACYLPRRIHVTGHVDVHEMEYDRDGELWLVNTLFSCLCTLDAEHSFRPRWRPPFISGYAPEDRCHLNGLAMVEGRPKYVTALGATDTGGGWRADKPAGGILMDVETDEVILSGLSMPHSPRWYQDQLWFLESGRGSLARVDLSRGTWETVAELPGFTRGLDFVGPLAFIGLSQVRESAIFSGIPIASTAERNCGVWVVDTRDGQILALLRFEGDVQEVFAVKTLPGIRFPEMLEWNDGLLGTSYLLPDDALSLVPQERLLEDSAQSPTEPVDVGSTDPFAAAYNRGVSLRDVDRFAEAAEAFREAVRADPSNADAHNDLANALVAKNDVDEAIESYRRALTLRPEFVVAHMNLGRALAKRGDLPRGLSELNWRQDTPEFLPLDGQKQRWQGGDLTGKRLLVYTEPGAGHTIQFVRFLPQARDLASRLVLVAPDPFLPLLGTAAGIDQLHGPGEVPLDSFDVYARLLSLPHHLGTTLETIPADVPYLAPSVDRPALPSSAPDHPLMVGLAWADGPTYDSDRSRSMPARLLAPLLTVPAITFYSLQMGPRAEEIAALHSGQAPVLDIGATLDDWAATADALAQLDLIITVDTDVADLAGALGIPAWVLLSYAPDWRWMLDRSDSPWYPKHRLFRQATHGGWGPVIEEVCRELQRTARAQ